MNWVSRDFYKKKNKKNNFGEKRKSSEIFNNGLMKNFNAPLPNLLNIKIQNKIELGNKGKLYNNFRYRR